MNFKKLSFVLVIALGFCRFVLGAAWEGTDDFASSISPSKWTIYQTLHGSMTIGAANGHASYIVSASASSEQNAAIAWNGTPLASENWTLQIDGHNTASASVNGSSQLQLVAFNSKTMGTTYEAFRISMSRNGSGGQNIDTATWVSGVTSSRQTTTVTNANFTLRLVYKTATGNIEAWYNQTGNVTGWTQLDTFSVASFPSGMLAADTFTFGVFANCYYGPISEGQLYADNFQLTNATLPAITNQPAAQAVPADSNAVFTVGVSGSTPLSYRWRFNTTNNILNATNSSLIVTNAQLTNAGNYDVVVTNAYGAITSSVANLQVITNFFQGLAAYYSFNGNANDASQYGNNGINRSNALFALGYNSSALSLNGGNCVEVLGNDSLLGMRQDTERTISVWVKLLTNNAAGNNTIISKYTAFKPNSANFYCSIMSSGAIRVAGTGTDYSDVGNVPIGEWHHLVFVLKAGNQNTKVYKDVKLVGTSTITYSANFTANSLLIGASWDFYSNPTLGFFFNGLLDEIRIFDRALAANEVAQLYAMDSRTLSANRIAGSNLNLTMACLPGQNYVLQTATNLTNPIQWVTVRTNMTDTNGIWQVTETNLNGLRKFYRITTP